MASRTAALFLLGIICIGLTSAQLAVDCCTQAADKLLPLHLISDYIIQEAGKGCDISATVFITKAGKRLCVLHPEERKWVKNHINILGRRKSRQQQ
ncbi:uncharacterized protein V6R79_012745 [Siganus canaliculatus]